MNVSIILGHPALGSFNHAIAQTAIDVLRANGHDVHFHDLYREHFDPVMTAAELPKDAVLPPEIERHCQEIGLADGIIIIHPNYWSAPPAILRGWVDRVLRAGRAYNFVPDGTGGAKPVGLLKASTGLVFTTANTPHEKELELFGDPLATHWLKVVFGLCGVARTEKWDFSPVIVSTPDERQRWLGAVRGAVDRYFPK
ncbi:MAG: NAD(P)H-dependent oxidoreductase [Acidobacteria bacterium]|nr:NAD(P)H-dependent oxidoreductase [Acidobacteriota bacterium]